MKSVIKDDDLGFVESLEVTILPGKLDGGLVGFETGIAEKATAQSAFFAKFGRHFFLQISARSRAPTVNRMASRYCTGMASRAFFMIKKELPQIKAAAKSMGFAALRMIFSLIVLTFVIVKIAAQ